MEHVFLWTQSGSDEDVPEERENSGFSEEKTGKLSIRGFVYFSRIYKIKK